jgi:thiol-disulfide isomerase/thioredoxin
MTKKAWLAALLVISYQIVSAQAAPTSHASDAQAPEAPFRKSPTVPEFHLLRADSTTYVTKEDLKKHRPVLIMYFSPECDHCKHQTEFILADYEKFRNIEIVMATYQPFSEMKDFIDHYKLADYPNFKVGRDEKFFMAPFYKITSLPFLALYDKNGDLISTFEGTHPADTILNAFAGKKG